MNKKLKIKVCGMKFVENREAVEQLPIDLLGFIFYPPSKRFVGDSRDTTLFNSQKQKVGVFVNESVNKILALAREYGLEYIQLHGKENPKTCEILRNQGLKIIKVFSVDEKFNFDKTSAYNDVVDFYLFDTKTKLHGGSGRKFDWKKLEEYAGKTPFFLSGGIQPEDAQEIKNLNHLQLFGVDLNSGFEDEPGLKNVEKLKKFVAEIK